MRPVRQPTIIRSGGKATAVGRWICAMSVAGFVLLAAVNAQRSGGMSLVAGAPAVFFACFLLYIATVRVELNGDEISYQHFFRRRRGLRLDQIRSARGTVRSTRGGPISYLVIEPIDPNTPAMKIRTDFFSHADVQAIRSFFGDKLKRHARNK
jgi:hypothetical protein